jgi:hypothetical protein
MKTRPAKILSFLGIGLGILSLVGAFVSAVLRGLMALNLFTPSSPEWVNNAPHHQPGRARGKPGAVRNR